MREGIQTVQICTIYNKKTGDEKSALLVPSAMRVGEPQSLRHGHYRHTRYTVKKESEINRLSLNNCKMTYPSNLYDRISSQRSKPFLIWLLALENPLKIAYYMLNDPQFFLAVNCFSVMKSSAATNHGLAAVYINA